MTKNTKKMIFGSMGAAGLVALASIADLALKSPFGGYSMVMDILFREVHFGKVEEGEFSEP